MGIVKNPIPRKTIQEFFPRNYGSPIQLLDAGKQREWCDLLDNSAKLFPKL